MVPIATYPEFVCPWWSVLPSYSQSARVEKMKRMRWCITEGLPLDAAPVGLMMPPRFPGGLTGGRTGDGLLPTPFFGPVPPAFPGVPLPGSSFPHPVGFLGHLHQTAAAAASPRGRGVNSRRPVSGLGGTLEVAGVPIAQWSGNKAGRGYSERSRIVVGGPTSVELGHQRGSRRGRGGARARHAGSDARSVTWAMDVDRAYDRSIGYHEPKQNSVGPVREGGDGGNEVALATRQQGDGANDVENHHGDHVGVAGMPPAVPQPGSPLGFKGQNFVSPLHDVAPPVAVSGGVDMAPVVLSKSADNLPGLGRGRGVPIGGAEQPPLVCPGDQPVEGAGRGRGWWWEKQAQP